MGCGFPTVCGAVAWPVSVADTQRAGQGLETLGFPWETEPRVRALSAYAYQRGVSLLLAKASVISRPRTWQKAASSVSRSAAGWRRSSCSSSAATRRR
jgi:hypothetical protein